MIPAIPPPTFPELMVVAERDCRDLVDSCAAAIRAAGPAAAYEAFTAADAYQTTSEYGRFLMLAAFLVAAHKLPWLHQRDWLPLRCRARL